MSDMNKNNNDLYTLCSQSENFKNDVCFHLFKTHLSPFPRFVTRRLHSLISSDYPKNRNTPESDSSPYIISDSMKTLTTNSPPNSVNTFKSRSSIEERPAQQNSSSMPIFTLEIIGIIFGAFIFIAIIGFCCFSYFKRRRAIFREPTLSHQETGTIATSTCDIPILQKNLINTGSNFSSSRTIDKIDYSYNSYTATLTSNAEIPGQRVDSPAPTEGGSSGFSVGGHSMPSYPSNTFSNSSRTLYYNGIEVPPPGARIIPLELQMQIGKEIMAHKEGARISLLPYLGSKYKSSDLPSSIINNNRSCSL